MRKALSALLLAASSVVTVAPALAQAPPGEIRRDQREVRQSQREVRQQTREYRQNMRQGDYRDAARDRRQLQDAQRDLRQDRRELHQDLRRDDRNDNRRYGWNDGRPGWNGGGRPGPDRRWDNGWRNDRRYDWQGYRSSNRRFYTLPRYYGPSGYGYRRYGVGVRIGAPFYAQRYWIGDPWAYRLPPVYGPYRWVRYFNDVLLVDIYTGEVRDVIYGFFY